MSPSQPDDFLQLALAHLENRDSKRLADLLRMHPDRAMEVERLRRILGAFEENGRTQDATNGTRSVEEASPSLPTDSLATITSSGRGNAGILATDEQLESGKDLGKYRLERRLGMGGMGVVWLARDTELGSQVALKFLPAVVSRDEESMRQLRREARNMLSLTHEHIVRCYTLDRVDGIAFLAMEYLRGPNLSALLRERGRGRGLEVREVLNALEQVASAIDYAHEHGCLHLDLKPSNLMLTRPAGDELVNGKAIVKVADFGLSYRTTATGSGSADTFTGGGTLAYIPPEILRNELPTTASDIYSLGATLYHLLSGQPPFLGRDLKDRVLNEPPPRLDSECTSLNEIILRCLEKEPSNRPTNARAVWQGALYLRHREVKPSVKNGLRGKLTGLFTSPKGKLPADFTAVDARGGYDGWARSIRDKRTGLEFQLVSAGSYMRGSQEGTGHQSERPRHRVEFRGPFYLATCLVTVREWRAFADGLRFHTLAEQAGIGVTLKAEGSWAMHPRANWKNPFPLLSTEYSMEDHPVTLISWSDAQQFCEQYGYRLPTEAEWEYACRAGTSDDYWWGNKQSKAVGCGNFCDTSFRSKITKAPGGPAAQGEGKSAGRLFEFDDGWAYTSPVRHYRSNPWGFHDMLGNVWEWCQDAFDPHCYEAKVLHAPVGMSGSYRPIRGGSFADGPDACRSAFRHRAAPDYASSKIGFRPLIQL